MTEPKDDLQKHLDILTAGIEQYKNATGTTAERLDLAESLIASFAQALGELGVGMGRLTQSVAILLDGVAELKQRTAALENQLFVATGFVAKKPDQGN